MRRHIRSTGIAMFVALLATAACSSAESPASASISPDALAARLESGDAPLVLDVRSQAEYQAGHIPGAVWIPHDELASRLDELEGRESDEIVVHCKTGRRAAMAEQVLKDAGYTRVIDLEGHFVGWQEAGHPIE